MVSIERDVYQFCYPSRAGHPRPSGCGHPHNSASMRPAWAVQHLARLGARVLAALDGHDAVHEHPLDACGVLGRPFVRRAILERVEIEDCDVRPVALAD